jgi:hypothetical protein
MGPAIGILAGGCPEPCYNQLLPVKNYFDALNVTKIGHLKLDLDLHTPQQFSCRRYGELKSSERAMECIAIDRSR